MREPYIEGVATHDGPESCAGDREVVGEALTGARAGWVLSREIRNSRMLTSLSQTESDTGTGAIASPGPILRGRRPHARADSSCARTGRSTGRLRRMVPRAVSGRPEAGRR